MFKWQSQPFKIEVKKGQKLAFCSCNLSKNGPYCDGSHSKKNTGKEPFVMEFEKDEATFICGCQHSSHRPFCDGSHKNLSHKETKK